MTDLIERLNRRAAVAASPEAGNLLNEAALALARAGPELAALRAKVAGLSLALAREATLRQEAERERDALFAAAVVSGGFAGAHGHYRFWRIGNHSGDVRDETQQGADAIVRHEIRKAAGLDAPQGAQDAPTGTPEAVDVSGDVAGTNARPGASQGPSRPSGAEGGVS